MYTIKFNIGTNRVQQKWVCLRVLGGTQIPTKAIFWLGRAISRPKRCRCRFALSSCCLSLSLLYLFQYTHDKHTLFCTTVKYYRVHILFDSGILEFWQLFSFQYEYMCINLKYDRQGEATNNKYDTNLSLQNMRKWFRSLRIEILEKRPTTAMTKKWAQLVVSTKRSFRVAKLFTYLSRISHF